MTWQAFKNLFAVNRAGRLPSGFESRHLSEPAMPTAVYVIGDVHGCIVQLRSLEQMILEDGAGLPGDKLIVLVGDYLDRGPDSAAVLDRLLASPPPSFRRVCLMGNHEVMASAFFEKPHPRSDWLKFGGRETLRSYGLTEELLEDTRPAHWGNLIAAHVPSEHLHFIRSLPWTLSLPGWIFVHAGLRPGVPLADQSPDDLFWIRDEFFEASDDLKHRIVHGHTPAPEPVFTPRRICVDTGAYATGTLTALKILPDGQTEILKSF